MIKENNRNDVKMCPTEASLECISTSNELLDKAELQEIAELITKLAIVPSQNDPIYLNECSVTGYRDIFERGVYVDIISHETFCLEWLRHNYNRKSKNGLNEPHRFYFHLKKIRESTKNDSSILTSEVANNITQKNIPNGSEETLDEGTDCMTEQKKEITSLGLNIEGGFKQKKSNYRIECNIYDFYKNKYYSPKVLSNEVQNLCDKVTHYKVDLVHDEVSESWEFKLQESKYSRNLFQKPGIQIKNTNLYCAVCQATTNLWLNLSDGYIGCGRKIYNLGGGCLNGDEGAALIHFYETGQRYPLVVKLGTITKDGKADVFSYALDENESVIDPFIAEHLAKLGINIMELEKTEATTLEKEIETNQSITFSQSLNKDIEPVCQPGKVGLVNLGNTCYMNAVLQILFHVKEVGARFLNNMYCLFINLDRSIKSHNDLLLQFAKICFMFFKDHYINWKRDYLQNREKAVIPMTTDHAKTETTTATTAAMKASLDDCDSDIDDVYCVSINPEMFRNCINKKSSLFNNSRQQDCCEYLSFLLDQLMENEHIFLDRVCKGTNHNKRKFSEHSSTSTNGKKKCGICRKNEKVDNNSTIEGITQTDDQLTECVMSNRKNIHTLGEHKKNEKRVYPEQEEEEEEEEEEVEEEEDKEEEEEEEAEQGIEQETKRKEKREQEDSEDIEDEFSKSDIDDLDGHIKDRSIFSCFSFLTQQTVVSNSDHRSVSTCEQTILSVDVPGNWTLLESDEVSLDKVKISLMDCLKKYIATEIVDEFLCPKEKIKTRAKKVTRVKTFPPYLLIQIKRFYADINWTAKKINIPIETPEILNLEFMRAAEEADEPGEVVEEDSFYIYMHNSNNVVNDENNKKQVNGDHTKKEENDVTEVKREEEENEMKENELNMEKENVKSRKKERNRGKEKKKNNITKRETDVESDETGTMNNLLINEGQLEIHISSEEDTWLATSSESKESCSSIEAETNKPHNNDNGNIKGKQKGKKEVETKIGVTQTSFSETKTEATDAITDVLSNPLVSRVSRQIRDPVLRENEGLLLTLQEMNFSISDIKKAIKLVKYKDVTNCISYIIKDEPPVELECSSDGYQSEPLYEDMYEIVPMKKNQYDALYDDDVYIVPEGNDTVDEQDGHDNYNSDALYTNNKSTSVNAAVNTTYNVAVSTAAQDEAKAVNEMTDTEKVDQIVNLGFSREIAIAALIIHKYNLPRAIEYILTEDSELTDEKCKSIMDSRKIEDGPAVYELIGSIVHIGKNANCGHYIAYVKDDRKWYICNDNKIGRCETNLGKDEAYIHLYKRI